MHQAKPGAQVLISQEFPCDGQRAGIIDNKIVIVGGLSHDLNKILDQVYVGTVDPANPSNITWTAIQPFPDGPVTELAGGSVKNSINKRVYFSSGNYPGSDIFNLGATWAYDLDANEWKIGPYKPTHITEVSDFSPMIVNDTVYMAIAGGTEDTVFATDANEWLCLGPSSLVLPLHLLDFTANLSNGQVLLNWKVSEDGLGGFYDCSEKCRWYKLHDFTQVQAGHAQAIQTYNVYDPKPFNGRTYYRIKLVNNDGKVSYSQVRIVGITQITGLLQLFTLILRMGSEC